MCEKLVEEMYQAKKKEYLFKEDGEGRFITGHLVDDRLGSAIRTYRQSEVGKSRFPHIFWKM